MGKKECDATLSRRFGHQDRDSRILEILRSFETRFRASDSFALKLRRNKKAAGRLGVDESLHRFIRRPADGLHRVSKALCGPCSICIKSREKPRKVSAEVRRDENRTAGKLDR